MQANKNEKTATAGRIVRDRVQDLLKVDLPLCCCLGKHSCRWFAFSGPSEERIIFNDVLIVGLWKMVSLVLLVCVRSGQQLHGGIDEVAPQIGRLCDETSDVRAVNDQCYLGRGTVGITDPNFRADIVEVAPDVSGLVTDIMVRDNQQVRRGDILFCIDRAALCAGAAAGRRRRRRPSCLARSGGKRFEALSRAYDRCGFATEAGTGVGHPATSQGRL